MSLAKCSVCKDLFDVMIIDRRGEISIEISQTIGFAGNILIHRPGICNGPVSLVGKEANLALTGLDHLTPERGERIQKMRWGRLA